MPSVFLTGCSGQGKTTNAKLLQHELFYPISDGIARSSPHKMGTKENQEWISRQVYHNCMAAYQKIHCRTPLDVAGYSIAFDIDCPIDEQHIEMWSRTNPVVIYHPFVLPIVDDNFRPVNVELNQKVDDVIRQKMTQYNIDFYTLSDGTPEERVQEIMKYLERFDF